MTDFLDYKVATVGVAGFPIPVTGLTLGLAVDGLLPVVIAPDVALHVAADEINDSGFTARQFLENYSSHTALRAIMADQALARTTTVFDLVAVLHFCLAVKREADADTLRSVRIFLDARNDLIALLRSGAQ